MTLTDNAKWLAELDKALGHHLLDMMGRWYPGLRNELANAWRENDLDRVLKLLIIYPKQDSQFPSDFSAPLSRQYLVRARILANIPDVNWRDLLKEIEGYREYAVSEGVSADTYEQVVAALMDTVNLLRRQGQATES